jgi:FtsZ-interacting cell division protein ZipA
MAILNGWRITRTGVVFVIGVMVLVALVLGGIWLVRDRGEQTRRQEAAKIAEQNLQAQSEAPADVVQSTNNGTVAPTESTETDSPLVATTTGAAQSTLPETGIDVSRVAIISVLVLAIAYYATSRRAVRGL